MREPVGIQTGQAIVERDILAGDATADNRGMRGEDGTDGQVGHLDIQQTGTGHPLVELGDHFLVRLDIIAHKTFDHLAAGIAEEGRFDIIPAAAEGIDTETFPELGQDIVLAADERRKVDEDGHRFPGNVPMADPKAETFFRRRFPPRAEQQRIFLELRVLIDIAPNIRPDVDMMVFLE